MLITVAESRSRVTITGSLSQVTIAGSRSRVTIAGSPSQITIAGSLSQVHCRRSQSQAHYRWFAVTDHDVFTMTVSWSLQLISGSTDQKCGGKLWAYSQNPENCKFPAHGRDSLAISLADRSLGRRNHGGRCIKFIFRNRNNNQKETNETMMKMKGLDDYKEINDAAVYSSSHRPSRNIRPRWHQDPRGGNHGHKKDHKSRFACHSRRLD